MTTLEHSLPSAGGGRCYFLELPVELRLRIYSYIYCMAWRAHFKICGDGVISHRSQNKPDTALVKTCRTINNEANAALYEQVDCVLRIEGAQEQPSGKLKTMGRFMQLVKRMYITTIHIEIDRLDLIASEIEYICESLEANKKVKICMGPSLGFSMMPESAKEQATATKRKFEQEISRLQIDMASETVYEEIYGNILDCCDERIKQSEDRPE